MFPLPLILPFLAKYWKYIVLGVLVLSVVGFIYFKGKSAGEQKVWSKLEHLVKTRVKQENKVKDRNRKVKEKIEKSRIKKPIDDARDSCILSHDPHSGVCDSFLK